MKNAEALHQQYRIFKNDEEIRKLQEIHDEEIEKIKECDSSYIVRLSKSHRRELERAENRLETYKEQQWKKKFVVGFFIFIALIVNLFVKW